MIKEGVMAEAQTMEDLKEELEESLKKGPMDANYEELKEAMNKGEVFSVKILSQVKGGVTTEVNGLRAFIPASQLSADYIEDIAPFVNKTVEACLVTVDPAKNSVIMSVKEVEVKKKNKAREEKMASIKVSEDYMGKVESIKDYGAFIDLGDGVKGLLHISRICNKRIKTPAEVIKEGEEIKVRVVEIKDGKVSLSTKVFDETPVERRAPRKERTENEEDEAQHIEHTEGDIATSLSGLLSGIKLDN